MENTKKEIQKYLNGKFKYDEYGQYIWIVDSKGGHQKFADLRGWGAIQNLFKKTSGEIEFDKAEKFQDELGKWAVNALNNALSSLPSTEERKTAEETKTKWTHCPECGSKEFVNENIIGQGYRECRSCGQEWWNNIDYTETEQIILLKKQLSEAKKEIERLKDSLAHSIHAGKETEKEFVRLKKSEASLQSELSAMRERVEKQWINIENGFPEETDVRLFIEVYEHDFQCDGYYNSEIQAWCYLNDTIIPYKVTHWMPLPEPPQSLNQTKQEVTNIISDKEDIPYCRDCGSSNLSYLSKHANGVNYKCKECKHEFIY